MGGLESVIKAPKNLQLKDSMEKSKQPNKQLQVW